jgi:hypothetical protein
MKIIAWATLAVGMLAGAATALAQSHSAAPNPPRLLETTTNFIDVTRGPSPPPAREFAPPPPSLARPMERVPQVTPLSPRIGQ